MVRCAQCGWDKNSESNIKCEKCGAKLTNLARENNLMQPAKENNEVENRDFLNKTVKGCPECGYQIRPGETQCPECGYSLVNKNKVEINISNVDFSDKNQVINSEIANNKKFVGTVIFPKTPQENQENENSQENNEKETRMGGKKVVAFLVTYSINPLGEFFPIYEGKNYVGNANEMNIQIKGDVGISNKHLCILYRAVDKKFKFEDTMSSNGTFINDELIDAGELKNNDVITIGKTKLIIMIIPEIINN